jgi:hypothetical protein
MKDASEDRRRIAIAVRDACIEAAKQGYERATMSGLCEDGALEAALSAMQMLDIDAIVRQPGEPLP